MRHGAGGLEDVGCWAGCWLLPPLLQDAHGWCTWKRCGVKRREPSSYARVAWRFLYISVYSVNYWPPKKVRQPHLCLKEMMNLPGKPELNERLLRPPFSPGNHRYTWRSSEKPPFPNCSKVRDAKSFWISTSGFLGSQDVSTRVKPGWKVPGFWHMFFHRSWKSPQGRGGYTHPQCHPKTV